MRPATSSWLCRTTFNEHAQPASVQGHAQPRPGRLVSLRDDPSIPYYELCARLCEEFAHFFDKLVTGHETHGMGRVGYWVSAYLTHAENIRRGIGFVKQQGDRMPMLDFLGAPSSDFKGLVENSFGCETREEWQQPFERVSYACGTGADVLRGNQWDGLYWLNRESLNERDRKLLDDGSVVGDRAMAIGNLVEYQLSAPPQSYPSHPINRAMRAKPGERCPRSGVWVPVQWADGQAGDFSLAFCIEGRPMQPAYQIVGFEKHVVSEADPEHGLPEFASYSTVTRAVDTTWYFVEKPGEGRAQPVQPPAALRDRGDGGQAGPREGFWLTPAKPGSRRHFRQGEVMPIFQSDYGKTIWQWDEMQ